jgi:thiamine biosynthesis lipoprotein
MEERPFFAMGSQMRIVLDATGPAARRAVAAGPNWFAAWERRLSRFRPDSELSRLNRAAGRWQPVSAVLWAVLRTAMHAARQTEGLVTPTLLPALEAAGYDRPFALLPSGSGSPRPPAAADPGAWQWLAWRRRPRAVRLPPGVRLDLGGSAKGWAADQAAHRLAARGPVLVDAGGDIAVSGPRADGTPWPVAVADPAAPERDLALLALRTGAVATSGRDYRRWRQGGVWQHHILDPRTARPAVTDVCSATVIAPTAPAAEVAAKLVLILGARAGLAWLEARPTLAGLLVLDDGQVVASRRLPRYLWR